MNGCTIYWFVFCIWERYVVHELILTRKHVEKVLMLVLSFCIFFQVSVPYSHHWESPLENCSLKVFAFFTLCLTKFLEIAPNTMKKLRNLLIHDTTGTYGSAPFLVYYISMHNNAKSYSNIDIYY